MSILRKEELEIEARKMKGRKEVLAEEMSLM
jgi:hypothetical protein